VEAVLANLDTAPIGEPLRAMLAFLRTLTRDHQAIGPDDITNLFALGITRAQLEDALAVCFAFNVITRLADTFHFDVPGPAAFASSANMLLKRGYKM
jgi:hypothetical protein